MNHKCPICNELNSLEEEFCQNCSWELIDIPKNSSLFLIKYFKTKIEKHKNIFEKKIKNINTIKKLNDKYYSVDKNLTLAKEENKKLSVNNTKLIQEIENKREIENQLKTYVERYGDSFEVSSNSSKKRLIVYWKIVNNEIHLTSTENFNNVANKIAVLFSKDIKPQIGNFDFSVIGKIHNNIIRLELTGFPKGSYTIKPISLTNRIVNITFMSEEQSLNPSNYNKNKLKINIL